VFCFPRFAWNITKDVEKGNMGRNIIKILYSNGKTNNVYGSEAWVRRRKEENTIPAAGMRFF
jgi:hypothetical protein